MKNKLPLFLVLIFSCITATIKAQEMSTDMDAFISRMEGATLEELEIELNEGIEALKAFAGFFEPNGSKGIKQYTKEEERFEEPFKIDTSIISKATRQFKNIGFQQIFRDDTSLLKFKKIGDDYWNTQWMEEGMKEQFIPKTIFYRDGTQISEGISKNEMSFFFETLWGEVKVIDSIAIDYRINYTKTYDSLLLTKKSKKLNYKEGVIKIEKLNKNHLYLTVTDKYANGLYLRALNIDGKPLNQNSSSFSPTPDGDSKDGLGKTLSLLEDLQTKLKAKKFKDTEALKKHILKEVSKLETVKDKDGVYHKKYYFEGNIESLILYIETEEESKTVSFTATNNSGFGDIIFMQSKTENIFLDANAKELFRMPFSPIQNLGGRYFQSDSLYYHLNLNTQKLDELKAKKIWEAKNGLFFIQKTAEDSYLMYNDEHELLSNIGFKTLYVIDNEFVQGVDTQDENYILSSKGTIKKLEGISEIRDPFDGRMLAQSNGKFGYIDVSGEIRIPFIYTNAENFNEGMAIVAKEDKKYGLIDTNGTTVLPLIYFGILSYENGIAWVSTGDGYQLIDKTGKILVTANGGSYSVSGSGVNKTYRFGDATYDAFGKVIETND